MIGRPWKRRPVAAAALVAGAAVLSALAACSPEVKDSGDNLVAGKRLFVEKCGSCHVLERAGTTGTSGPNLDTAFARALRDGFGRDTVKGIVEKQIEVPNPSGVQAGPAPREGDRPPPKVIMPPNLVTGEDAENVAAYVAFAAAKPGEDTGLLATAVPKPGAGRPITVEGDEVDIEADPSGQLAYVTKQVIAEPGELTIASTNESSVPHNIALEGPGIDIPPGPVVQNGGVSTLRPVDLEPGKYTYYCSVPGHREGGMLGTLTVKK